MLPFLQRLRERKIVQWAIACFAGDWVSLEVFDMIDAQTGYTLWSDPRFVELIRSLNLPEEIYLSQVADDTR